VGQIHLVTGLSPNHSYYFAVKTSDESGNVSAIGRLKVTTLSDCCGGDARARLAPGGEGSAGEARIAAESAATTSPNRTATPTAAIATGAGTALLVEASPGSSGFDVRLVSIGGESYDGQALSSDAGVLLQAPEGTGQWTTQLHYALPPGNRLAVCAPEQATRWVFLEPCAVEQVLTTMRGKEAAWALDWARHSRAGDVTALLAAGSPPALLPGDTLSLHYSAAAESEVPPSGWFLVLDKLSGGTSLTRAAGRRPEISSPIPASFALLQNQPNPFSARTTIRFELPVGAIVRLEVFDLQGRRLRVLADHYYGPGYHSVEWEKRTVEPGVYFYRIQAGPFRERRKMVLLP